jgi:hypothetical protein
MKRWRLSFAICLALATAVHQAAAEVVRIVIDGRGDVLSGQSFGTAGPYEKITGRIFFAFDPANPTNARIVDIDKASRNAEGLVEAWANFVVLRPKYPPDRGSIALLEVSNRGGKASLRYFNGGISSLDPTIEDHFGDGFLMRMTRRSPPGGSAPPARPSRDGRRAPPGTRSQRLDCRPRHNHSRPGPSKPYRVSRFSSGSP